MCAAILERKKVYRNKEVGNPELQREDSLFIGIIINSHNIPIANVCLHLAPTPAYCIMKPVGSFYHSEATFLREREGELYS